MYIKLTEQAKKLQTGFHDPISGIRLLGNKVAKVESETRIIKDYLNSTITVASEDEYNAYVESLKTTKKAATPTTKEVVQDPAPEETPEPAVKKGKQLPTT